MDARRPTTAYACMLPTWLRHGPVKLTVRSVVMSTESAYMYYKIINWTYSVLVVLSTPTFSPGRPLPNWSSFRPPPSLLVVRKKCPKKMFSFGRPKDVASPLVVPNLHMAAGACTHGRRRNPINFWCENSCFTVQGVLFGTGAQFAIAESYCPENSGFRGRPGEM